MFSMLIPASPQVVVKVAMVLGMFLWIRQIRRVPGSRLMDRAGRFTEFLMLPFSR